MNWIVAQEQESDYCFSKNNYKKNPITNYPKNYMLFYKIVIKV